MTNAILQINALPRRFGLFTAVDGLDLAVNAGKSFSPLGSYGAGKTSSIPEWSDFLRPLNNRENGTDTFEGRVTRRCVKRVCPIEFPAGLALIPQV